MTEQTSALRIDICKGIAGTVSHLVGEEARMMDEDPDNSVGIE